MMLVKLLQTVRVKKTDVVTAVYHSGHIYRVPKDMALSWIAAGNAEDANEDAALRIRRMDLLSFDQCIEAGLVPKPPKERYEEKKREFEAQRRPINVQEA